MQPPPGYSQQPQGQPYPQQPQGPQYQQYPQQAAPGAPQYAMQQYPYYQPAKKGMPGWAWGLIIGGVVLMLVFMVVVAMVGMAASSANTRDAQRAEGEQLMGTARDYLRVSFARTGLSFQAFQAFSREHAGGSFSGKYYNVDPDPRELRGEVHDVEVTCSPTPAAADKGRGSLKFAWTTGSSDLQWR